MSKISSGFRYEKQKVRKEEARFLFKRMIDRIPGNPEVFFSCNVHRTDTKGVPFYKCGHDREAVVLDNNPMSFSAYLTWSETKGYSGDKTKCWECYNKKEESKNGSN